MIVAAREYITHNPFLNVSLCAFPELHTVNIPVNAFKARFCFGATGKKHRKLLRENIVFIDVEPRLIRQFIKVIIRLRKGAEMTIG